MLTLHGAAQEKVATSAAMDTSRTVAHDKEHPSLMLNCGLSIREMGGPGLGDIGHL